MDQIGKAFEEIAEATVRRAQKVECSVEDYVGGLNEIIDRLMSERALAEEAGGLPRQ